MHRRRLAIPSSRRRVLCAPVLTMRGRGPSVTPMTATRYTAQGRRNAEAARAAKLEARDRRHAGMSFEDFLEEWAADYAIVTDDADVAHARAYHAELVARFAA